MISKHELTKLSAYLSAFIFSAFIIGRGLKYLLDKYKKRSNALLVGIYGLSIMALCLTFYYYDAIVYKNIATANYSDISYNSKSSDKELSDIKELLVPADVNAAEVKEVYINSHFKVNSISNWNNIFQTAASNTGIRMELAKPSELGLIIGTNNFPGYRGFILTDSLNLDKWHEFDIALTKDKMIKVILDGKTVINITDVNFDYGISDIAVGTGMSKTRQFDGEIADFKMEIKPYKINKMLFICVSGLKMVMAILLFLIPYYFLSTSIHKTK